MIVKYLHETTHVKWTIRYKPSAVANPMIITEYKENNQEFHTLFIQQGFIVAQFHLLKNIRNKSTSLIIHHIILSMNHLIKMHKNKIDLQHLFFMISHSNPITTKLLYHTLFNEKQLYRTKMLIIVDTPCVDMQNQKNIICFHKSQIKNKIQNENSYYIKNKNKIPMIVSGYIEEPFTCVPCKQKRLHNQYKSNLISNLLCLFIFFLFFIFYLSINKWV